MAKRVRPKRLKGKYTEFQLLDCLIDIDGQVAEKQREMIGAHDGRYYELDFSICKLLRGKRLVEDKLNKLYRS